MNYFKFVTFYYTIYLIDNLSTVQIFFIKSQLTNFEILQEQLSPHHSQSHQNY